MKYVVTVNGERYEVEVEKVDGRSGRMLSRKPLDRRAEQVEETRTVVEPVAPKVEKKVAPAPAAPVASGDAKSVVSPMPGVILDIKVNIGDKVEVGQNVVLLEAMKMENDIVSEFAGVVSAIKVKKGETVDTDAVLIEIK